MRSMQIYMFKKGKAETTYGGNSWSIYWIWQVSDLNEEIKPHCNICDKESVKEEYNKPLPIDEPFLPIEENNGEIQNKKILLSDNDSSDNIKYEQV